MRDIRPRARAWDTNVAAHAENARPFGDVIVDRLRSRGFEIAPGPNCLYVAHARKGDLEALVEVGVTQARVEFYQSLNVSNPHGGRFDFDKLARMSRAMQLQCAVEMAAVFRAFLEHGCAPGAVDHRWPASDYDIDRLALSMLRIADGRTEQEESPLASFNRRWGADRFERDATGWPSPREASCWPTKDRDGKPLRAGDVKYFRPTYPDGGKGKGYLMRAAVFPGVNGQWFPVCNGVAVAHLLHANEFFDCERPELEPRRVIPSQVDRLEQELAAALKGKDYRRVRALADALARAAQAKAVAA